VRGGYKCLLWSIAGLAVAVLLWALPVVDRFEVTKVWRTGDAGVREYVHVSLKGSEGKAFRIMPTVEVWDGDGWRATVDRHVEFDEYVLRFFDSVADSGSYSRESLAG
jgi:hypothetical protein